MSAPVAELIVCTTCRPAGASRELPAAGLVLFEAVAALQRDGGMADLQVRGIACLSACARSCAVALQAPGKPTYCFGDLSAEPDTAVQVLACARMYAERADGTLPRSERPERLRSGILLKLPAHAVVVPD